MAQTLQIGDPGHTAVSPKQRAHELESIELFKLKRNRVYKEMANEVKSSKDQELANLGTLARLMRHDQTSTENLVLEDGGGQFAVPICYMSRTQRKECVQIVVDLGRAGADAVDPKEDGDPVLTINSIYDRLANLAAALVTDKELSEGIKNGSTSDGKNMMIVQFSLKRSVAMEESGSTFRVN